MGIALISFPLLYYGDRIPDKVDLTLKVTGHQWYWTYEYPDNGDISFDSHAIWDSSDVTQDQANKLIADASQSLADQKPSPCVCWKLITVLYCRLALLCVFRLPAAMLSIHGSFHRSASTAWRFPAAVNEVWMKVDHAGIYYGQCSMICGNGHGYMPIVIEGVTQDQFTAWVQSKKTSVGQLTSPFILRFCSTTLLFHA